MSPRMIQVFPSRVRKGAFINYAYLVKDATGEAILVDPGAEFDTLVRSINSAQARLKGILLTHHHADHSGLAGEFAAWAGVPVFMSRCEIEFYRFNCTNLMPVEPDLPFFSAGMEIMPLHTPGHTAGSTCYGIGNYLFSGDTLFIEGCGMCFGRGSDPIDLHESLRKLRIKVSHNAIVYPGHSYGAEPGVTFAEILRDNIYFHLNIDDFIRFRMRNNQTKLFDFK
jgi:glyoxylase-like metal-dependent hydrolase (beta-lactamase superfamily II)